MSLGEKLQSLRESQGLSQKELAIHIGITTGAIAEWESNEATPNLTELSRLSKALNVSSDVLLDAVTETTVTSSAAPDQAPKLVTTPIRKRRKTAWIIYAAVLCIVLATVAIMLRPQPIPTPEPLTFAEDTARIEAADASVVTIFCYDYKGELAATGSGFIAFDGQTVITNYHVMTSAYTCKISTNQDISYGVYKILCYDKEQDIAILQVAKDTGLQPLPLGNSSIIKKGETVVAIGSPLGIKNTISTGILSGRLMESNMDILQFTAPISSGSSGGALFDNYGNVIGITYASYTDGQNLNLAIPVELAQDLYNSRGAAKSISAICIEEYPHITYLSDYKNVPVVTLADLKLNPEKYDKKFVRLSIYVSSWGKDGPYPEFESGFWYFAEQPYLSFDYEYDHDCNYYWDSPVALCYTDTWRSKYLDDSIKPGDRVEVIAHFNFHSEGERVFPDSPELDACWTRDMASLSSIIIWKS